MITSTATPNQSLNINEASKCCGLSPSVLRIWELRYGWPNPKRKTNGYRAYNQHQVAELKRVAALVKAGTPISNLIIDGLPRWPTDHSRAPAPRSLSATRSLPKPDDAAEALLHRDLIEALETRRGPAMKELLQRIFWTVRPTDEPKTALVPCLVAIAELRRAERKFAEENEVIAMVKDRCIQLLRMLKTPNEALLIVPARESDHALATLTALISCYRGTPARPWLEAGEPTSAYVTVSDGELPEAGGSKQIGRLTTLGGQDIPGLVDLLDANQPLTFVKSPSVVGA
ncbi:MAG: MerR family transcriptional regulator [Planctomycetes bacterium]|nr:MerR family transcriptional regulator [Planctomycetota bacterium]